MTRRTALSAVGAAIGYLYGKPVIAEQGRGLTLILDGVDAILVQYQGQRIILRPSEIMTALQPEPLYPSQMQQMPPSPSKR